MTNKTVVRMVWAGVLLAVFSSGLAAVSVDGGKLNFVIVLADDVSWTDFGCTGSGLAARTPNIDKLATEGMRFNNFFCASAVCAPVRHELYTGLLPPKSGVFDNGNRPNRDFKNVVDYLRAEDYAVGLAGKLHFRSPTKFTKVQGFTVNCNDPAPSWSMKGAEEFINRARVDSKPFCLVLASVHAHHPWTVGDPSHFPVDTIKLPDHMVDTPETRACVAAHAAEVEELDHQVGATMKMLADLGLEENTVLVFLSEQGMAMPQGKWSVYDYGSRALAVFRWPGKIKPNTTTDAVAMYADVLPTLVELAGGDTPREIDGYSMADVLLNGTYSGKRTNAFIFSSDRFRQRAIRTRDYKLIWNPDPDKIYNGPTVRNLEGKWFSLAWQEWVEKAETDPDAKAKVDQVLHHPEFELYDLRKDPYELRNEINNPEYRTVAEQLKKELFSGLDALGDSDPIATEKKPVKHQLEK